VQSDRAVSGAQLRALAKRCEQQYLNALPDVYKEYLATGRLPREPGCRYPGPWGYLVQAARILRRAAALRDAGVPGDVLVGLAETLDREALDSMAPDGRALRLAVRAVETGRLPW
jgi:hypothetical protein